MEDGGGDAGECVCLVRGGGRDLDVGEDDGGEEGAGEEDTQQTHAHNIAGAAAAHHVWDLNLK